MNIFEHHLEIIKKLINNEHKQNNLLLPDKLEGITMEVPPHNFKADLSTNVAMILCKINNKSPLEMAEILKPIILSIDSVNSVDIQKPGFININLNKDYWKTFISQILSKPSSYGSDQRVYKKKYLIEFVSANPTGPLHVGHCRGAILGDVISNLLKFNKHKVVKEYYVNDYGSQISLFVKSVYLRIREIKLKEKFPINDEELYPGDYLVDIAKNIILNNPKLNYDNYEKIEEKLTQLSVNESLNLIKLNLMKLGIKHDEFISEKSIVINNEVEKVVKVLKEKDLLYEGVISAPERKKSKDYKLRKQILFKSTLYGDDKDRALKKTDSSWTYFASDAAYHNNKVKRGYDILINILGSDHTGYVKRITSLVEALSGDQNKLVCKVTQLVKLIKDGKPFKMSKRKGDYITVDDLLNEVGKDATRFIMLNRSSDVELDFDFTKIKEKSKDNPIYYVQYCYARISSVFKNLNLDIDNDITLNDFDFNFENDEMKIFRKISEWPKCVEVSSNKLEPHRITTYLYDIASEFHFYWNLGKDNQNKRFIINNKTTKDKIVFLKLISVVIKSGMSILNVDTPKSM
ncbi:MAG: arginine--tRNA ligase [Candidatus Pelagibacter sp.]|nr:arginine--tRNA ligase [Candidatus Pelagibacter sp.]|tara:strand:+ start:1216 stop:2943 length:1728 start_codon:yes stop_codon:yes gene_type:complete